MLWTNDICAGAGMLSYTAFGEMVDPNRTGPVGMPGHDPNLALPTRYRYAGGWGYEDGLITLYGANPNLPPITLQHVGARWYQPDIGRFVQRELRCPGGGGQCLKTVTTFDASDIYDYHVASIEYPDGRLDQFSYLKGTWQGGDPNNFVEDDGPDRLMVVTHGTTGAPSGVAYKTTKDITLSYWDPNGEYGPPQHNIESRRRVYTGSGYELVGLNRTIKDLAFSATGQSVEQQRLDPEDESVISVQTTVKESCCSARKVTDASGVTTRTEYDIFGRPKSATKFGADGDGSFPAQPSVVTAYQYGFDGTNECRTVRQLIGNSAEPPYLLASQSEHDLAGRTVSEKTLEPNTLDVLLETTYDYGTGTGGGEQVTITRPDTSTEVTQNYADGRTKQVTRNSDVQQYYDYEVSDAQQTTVVYTGPDGAASPRWTRTTYDMLGRVVVEQRPGWAPTGESTTVETHYAYYDDANDPGVGQLKKTWTEVDGAKVQAPTVYVYDELGAVGRSGLDLTGDDDLTPDSADRYTDQDNHYQFDSGAWWFVSESATYGEDPNGAPSATRITTGVQKERLTGFSGDVIRESVSTDIHNNATTSQTTLTFVNEDEPLMVETIDHPDSSINEVRETYNGLSVYSRSKCALNEPHLRAASAVCDAGGHEQARRFGGTVA